MANRRLLWQLVPTYLLITLLSLVAVAWYASGILERAYLERVESDLGSMAHLIRPQVHDLLLAGNRPAIDDLCDELGRESATRITVILPSGKVVGDSEEDPAVMGNHADRPEIVEALQGREGVSKRHSPTLGKDMYYVAIPVNQNGSPIGVLRVSMPIAAITQLLRGSYLRIFAWWAAIAVVAGSVILVVSRRISGPLEYMRSAVMRMSAGELDKRLPVPPSAELAELAEAVNDMAAELDRRIRAITDQRNQEAATLASMVEGVIAVDTEERIISINRAAEAMLGVERSSAEGKSIQEALRSSKVQELIKDALSSPEPVERELVLVDGGERHLQARGGVLRDSSQHRMGAVIVFNDITRLRRLENVRREFVANVSHELKTPLTAVKGAIETLLEGAYDSTEDAQRFLNLTARQVDRLNAIIEDLLLLSRIEEQTEGTVLSRVENRIGDVLDAAVETCGPKAREKGIEIRLDCDQQLSARINSDLVEHAVANLIDNAIKYSDPGGFINVDATAGGGQVFISVTDRGCGIERKHLPRIFERFYRVDKGRSRKLGGTGLGLSIVKHIAQAHGGRVSVESTPGQGSTFTIRLPL